MNPLQSVLLTLQYCLETFQTNCECQCCEPCTQGQKNIQKAIRVIENLLWPSANNPNTNVPVVRYALERPGARAEFLDKAALVQFLCEMLPAALRRKANTDATEIAAQAATRQWTLLEFGPSEYVQYISLLQAGLNVIHALLETTELNMDDLEPTTLEALHHAASFQNLAARMGFHHNCDVLTDAEQPATLMRVN